MSVPSPGGMSLTARLAALFAAMASGLLIIVGIAVDRAVSAHFDELDQHDLAAKLVAIETLLATRGRASSRVTSRHFDHGRSSRVFISRSNRPYGLTCSQISGVRAA